MLLKENELPTCATCIFSKLTNSIHKCINGKPVSQFNEHNKYAGWPIVRPDDVCGSGIWFRKQSGALRNYTYQAVMHSIEEGKIEWT